MPHTRTPACPECQSPTAWVRATPAKSGYVENTYECPRCLALHTTVEPDPIKKAEGWVNSNLKPPA